MTPRTRRKRRRQSAQDLNVRRVVLPAEVITDLLEIGARTGHAAMKDTIRMLCKRYALGLNSILSEACSPSPACPSAPAPQQAATAPTLVPDLQPQLPALQASTSP